jgi:hypothetical protein
MAPGGPVAPGGPAQALKPSAMISTANRVEYFMVMPLRKVEERCMGKTDQKRTLRRAFDRARITWSDAFAVISSKIS